MGNIVKSLMDEGAKLGVSSRGMGSLDQKNGANYVRNDFYLATAADEGDKILLEDDTGHAIILNAAEEQYFLSAINETAGSDGAVHVEIVAQGNSI